MSFCDDSCYRVAYRAKAPLSSALELIVGLIPSVDLTGLTRSQDLAPSIKSSLRSWFDDHNVHPWVTFEGVLQAADALVATALEAKTLAMTESQDREALLQEIESLKRRVAALEADDEPEAYFGCNTDYDLYYESSLTKK